MQDSEQLTGNYQLIADAISYLYEHRHESPDLEELSSVLGVSPFHLQRIFSHWAGISPKQFLRVLNLGKARERLNQAESNLFQTSLDLGMSSPSRLHDLTVDLLAMTPAEYARGGQDLEISWCSGTTPLGIAFLGSTPRGICWVSFEESAEAGMEALLNEFPNARLNAETNEPMERALEVLRGLGTSKAPLKLHVKGSSFQIQVWQALLQLPFGSVTSYAEISRAIDKPGSSRAVGNAIGSNPVAYLIPCHRVLRSTGALGGYMWGLKRKEILLGWEKAVSLQCGTAGS